MKGSIGSAMVSAPDGQRSLTYVDVASLARGERTPGADGVRVQSAFDHVNGVDVAQQEPDLDHVPRLAVIRAEGGDCDECETFLGFAFVNDVTCGFFHDV